MASKYPLQLDDSLSLPISSDLVTEIKAVVVNNIRSATVAIEGELGVKPSGTYGTVKDRLDGVDETIALIQVGVIPQGPAGGDLGNSFPSPSVVGLQGYPISSDPPIDGYAIVWSDSDAKYISAEVAPNPATTTTIGVIKLSGDLGGTAELPSVLKINGATAPTIGSVGNSLQVSSGSALAYGPLNLAGGANYVAGILPSANQASQTMAGDVTGTTAVSVVSKINGAAAPTIGSIGNSLQVSGASALSYSALNLAGGANYVTGVLPVLNGGTMAFNYFSAPFYCNNFNTNSNTFVVAGTIKFNKSLLRTSGTRTIKLNLIGETTSPLASFQLYDFTNNAVISGTSLSTSSLTAVILATADISASLPSGEVILQVQMSMASGTAADRIQCDFAELLVEYS